MHEISEVSCSATVLRANMGGAKNRVHTDRFANFRFSNGLFLGWPLEWTSDGSASCAGSSGREVQTPQTIRFPDGCLNLCVTLNLENFGTRVATRIISSLCLLMRMLWRLDLGKIEGEIVASTLPSALLDFVGIVTFLN